MLKQMFLLMLLIPAFPLTASADGFDYNYLEGAFTSLSASGNGSSPSGVSADGSFAFDPNWHAYAGAEHVSGSDAIDAGAGWNTDLADKVDLFVEGEFISTDVQMPATDTGWGANAGLRFQAAPKFELDGMVSHTDVDSQTENTLLVRGLVSLDRSWRVFASYANNADYDTFMIGIRYDF